MGRQRFGYDENVGIIPQEEENRKVLLCLYFSIGLIFAGMILLGIGVHYIVRYQVYGAFHFEKSQCKVVAISNTSLENCGQQNICATRLNQSGTACTSQDIAVLCFSITVSYSTDPHLNTSRETNATFYDDIKDLWHHSECSFQSPSCSSEQSSLEDFAKEIKKWSSMLEKRTWFKCYSGGKDDHQAVGKLLYTSTIAFLVVFFPVLMILVGLGISGWSCFELYWSSTIEERSKEKLRQSHSRQRSQSNYSSTRPRVVTHSDMKQSTESVEKDIDLEEEVSKPMLPESAA